MPKKNDFHQRQRILAAKINDLNAEIPILVSATSEELSHPNNHFNLPEEEKEISRLQLFIKKGKMFAYDDNKPTTKITGLASKSITLFGKTRQMSPMSIMQNEAFFSIVKEKTHVYLQRVLNAPTEDTTYLRNTVDRLYHVINRSSPIPNEVIHLATLERDLAEPDSGRNRLTAEFSLLLLQQLREKISLNHDHWTVALDRVLSLKQRTCRAESYGIHRIAQQAFMLYQSRTIEEQTHAGEKVIVVDDHIQAGSAMYAAAEEIMDNNAHLLSIVCISAQKNNMFFNIQQDVKDVIISLLPDRLESPTQLNELLNVVGLSMETLTNVEGMILISILSDSNNPKHQADFEKILKQYDASEEINHSLFKHQKNSLIEEFEKPQVAFENLESELLLALKQGRYTVPYEKHLVLSDEEGQHMSQEITAREKLPWLIFDFDDTLHDLNNNTFIIFQHIIKQYTDVVIPIETIIQTRQQLKISGSYQYQEMLLDFIKPHVIEGQVTFNDMTNMYQEMKHMEPFKPKISREDFLNLRAQYRIGIITDGAGFATKVPKIKQMYGVDLDGYVHYEPHLLTKPSRSMYDAFCNNYHVTKKPIYVGDSTELDGGMARNANLNFIKCDPLQSTINMTELTTELRRIEERRAISETMWGVVKRSVEDSKLRTNDVNHSTMIIK